MTRLIACLIVLALLSMTAVAGAKDSLCSPKRISNEEAIRLAKAELAKRVKAFDQSQYSWAVVEEGCELRIEIEKRNELATGRKSSLVMTRAGKVRRYLGGM